MPFDSLVLSRHDEARRRYLAIMDAALTAVDPYQAVRSHLHRSGQELWIDGQPYDLSRFRRILVVGAGKAGAPMARAVEEMLGESIAGGLVVVKTGHVAPTRQVEIVEAGHPIPNQAGLDAGRRILLQLADAGADDLVLVLLSGGGSALLEAPAALTLAELQATTDALLACGATINEINALRKHLSLIKGGQLARAASPATLVTLVLSDVVGSPLDVIASGPTVPDPSTWDDAWAVVTKYDLAPRLPAAVLARLQAGVRGELPETPKPGDPIFANARCVIVGDNYMAARAASQRAAALGYHTLLLTTFVEGEACEVAKVVAALAKEVRRNGQPLTPPACLILGGETTVTLGAQPGHGGRNQELALAAALALEGASGVAVAALATDGSDGPTDSAGGLIDGETVARGRAAGLDAGLARRRHDAYPYLRATGDLLLTGPTQTNVNDLIFVWVE
ncbi:MAG TPA: glycerate kinase [Chloroflexi bacterium]|nr:glycerate kinase [Chloroflexota bacterium]HHW85660.1 glycerate kinase [Chloroflexota bacterium]